VRRAFPSTTTTPRRAKANVDRRSPPPGTQDSLRTRISRERVGIETDKMLKGPNPVLSIQLITTLGLYPHIFTVPPAKSHPPHPVDDAARASDILSSVLARGGRLYPHVHPALLDGVGSDTDTATDAATDAEDDEVKARNRRKGMWLACALAPFRGAMTRDKKKEVMMVEVVVREGLKVSEGGRGGARRGG
jgi:tRNA nucleotidyltransferase (CCA-adding enzyme)